MNLKIILLLMCFFGSSHSAHGQNSAPAKDDAGKINSLPKISENDVKGEDRERVLRRICRKTTECESLRVIKVEQPRLSETNIYLITKGNHSSVYALQYKKKFYVSAKENDFEKFLKNYRILAKPNFADAFPEVYRYFKFNDAAINPFYIIDENYLIKYADDLKRYETGYEKIQYQLIHSPQITKADNGDAEIEFYADNPSSGKLLKITIVLSSQYLVQEKSVVYRLEKPYEIK